MSLPQNTTELKLEHSITHNGKEISVLNIRRPKVRDNLIAGKKPDDGDKEVCLMSLLAGVDETVIHELDMIDYLAFEEVITGFRKKPKSESEISSEQ